VYETSQNPPEFRYMNGYNNNMTDSSVSAMSNGGVKQIETALWTIPLSAVEWFVFKYTMAHYDSFTIVVSTTGSALHYTAV